MLWEEITQTQPSQLIRIAKKTTNFTITIEKSLLFERCSNKEGTFRRLTDACIRHEKKKKKNTHTFIS